MPQRYFVPSGAMPTTAPIAKIATGTSTKTILQIATSAGNPVKIEKWGISFDGTTANTPVQCELIETGSVAATVTAHVASGVMQFDMVGDGGASNLTLGTAATGYNATAEGAITATRLGDMQMVPPTSGVTWHFPLAQEFLVPPSRILRVRVTTTPSVGCWTYVQLSA